MRSLTEVGRGFNHAISPLSLAISNQGKSYRREELFFGRMTVMFFVR